MKNKKRICDPVERTELAMLADFLHSPKQMKRYAEHFLVTADDFTIGTHRTAWTHLMNAQSLDDTVPLCNMVYADLGLKTSDAQNEFLDLMEQLDFVKKCRVHEFAQKAYLRKLKEATDRAYLMAPNGPYANEPEKLVKQMMDSVPKPPSMDDDELKQIAQESKFAQFPEIPDELLHVPGFIDKLVTYSMSVAHKPNRTLAFAGALAALAHLSGRLFTDRRDTRTNLFILAVGHSGIGKDSPRRVNRALMKASKKMETYKMNKTVFENISSGQAAEELLFRHPCTMLQLDEFQKTLLALRDKRNANAIDFVKYLNSLYSSSGSDYILRTKATAMEDCGRVVVDPSLTIFATGTDHGTYEALTPEIIEDGFLGRCLVFDSDFESDLNEFESERPQLPPEVVNQAEEFASRQSNLGVDNSDPISVNYDSGVNDRIKAIFKLIDERRHACKKNSDHVGEALWARAPEKVSKLALIYAVSANYINPKISLAAVNWAWDLTELLIKRMIDHVEIWMTAGRLDKAASDVMQFVTKQGGESCRRDVMRKHRYIDNNMIKEVEDLLESRGALRVVHLPNRKVAYTLLRDK